MDAGRQDRARPREGDGEEESGRKDQEAEGGNGKNIRAWSTARACVDVLCCRSLRVELSVMPRTASCSDIIVLRSFLRGIRKKKKSWKSIEAAASFKWSRDFIPLRCSFFLMREITNSMSYKDLKPELSQRSVDTSSGSETTAYDFKP